ncbi:MAG TPA: nuclear transport factor 2 family protein [Mesorhizobium sp.]|uniref:nuclear transport factor 2 family protein n=1 Tax=Mesorhizobium sp. TaxID=1871066 RepID=UPI002DDD1A21|nr:nuclear transport factor 2 family protein [Mesorhizobium sp.]HEV2503671.1 nuclear transport factor 2 family protein [Mesorhizobium sp.]
MKLTSLWDLEKSFWLGGVEVYEAHLADETLMIFPEIGILGRDAILESIRKAPRWHEVEMSEKHLAEAGDTAALAYAVVASVPARAPYHALCGSTYVRSGNSWRLLSHQQMPLTNE